MKMYNYEATKAIKAEIAGYEKQSQELIEQRSRIYESAKDDNRCVDLFEEHDIMVINRQLRELQNLTNDALYRLYKCEEK